MFSRLIHKISRLSLLRFFHIFLMYILTFRGKLCGVVTQNALHLQVGSNHTGLGQYSYHSAARARHSGSRGLRTVHSSVGSRLCVAGMAAHVKVCTTLT